MKKINLDLQYPYAYETHLHTSVGSACARSTPEEMVNACKEAGYTGIFVTEHFYYGNTAIDRSLPWKEWVMGYCEGYKRAKKEGDRIGLAVYFAWEASYHGTDFLIYGLDQEWLIAHPQIKDATVEEQYRMVKADGGMVVHAHPYRQASYISEIRLYPAYVDAVEVLNTSHANNPFCPPDSEFDKQALSYALEHDLPQTGGSDIHNVNLTYGGMAFSHPIDSPQAFIKAVLAREGKVLPNTPAFYEI